GHLLDQAVGQQQVGGLAAERPGPPDQPRLVGHRCVVQRCVVQRCASDPPSSRYRTAIRTLTPLPTCSTIVERTESATSAPISMPRFIGPGCMTMACSGSSAIRPESSPYRRLYSRMVGK